MAGRGRGRAQSKSSGNSGHQGSYSGGRGRGRSLQQKHTTALPGAASANNPVATIRSALSVASSTTIVNSNAARKSAHEWNPIDMSTNSHTADKRSDKHVFLSHLETLWKQKKPKEVSLVFVQYLEGLIEPEMYSALLSLVSECFGYNKGKSTNLAHLLVRDFDMWITNHPTLRNQLTQRLQYQALQVSTATEHMMNGELFELIAKVFRLEEIGCSGVSLCHQLISKGKLKEAAVIISALNIHQEFDMKKDMFAPLLLQDKVNVLETLVQKHPKQQLQLVLFFDEACQKSFDLNQLLGDQNGVKIISIRLNHQTMKKHGTRLMKKYGLESYCPNLSHLQAMGFVRHLLHRYYGERSLEHANWQELTRGAIGENRRMQVDIVDLLSTYELEEAVIWAKHYQLTDDEVSEQVKNYEPLPSCPTQEDWDIELSIPAPSYYCLKLAEDKIHIIDTEEGCYGAVNTIIQSNGPLGVDAEWKPVFTSAIEARLSIIQIATRTDVYIIDVLTLQHIPKMNWSPLVEGVFMNSSLIKLGYGFAGDVKMMRKAFSIWGDRTVAALIDICALHAAVNKALELPKEASKEKGISETVRQLLGGLVLNKAEQVSDWEKRPLRYSQLQYAALDAFCLIELFDKLKPSAEELKIDLHTKALVAEKTKKPRKPKTVRVKSLAVFGDSCKISSHPANSPIKFVVCNMLKELDERQKINFLLLGLGKQLRLLGLDVHIISDDLGDDHDVAAQIALTEGRIILTAGQAYDHLSALAKPGHCFGIRTDLTAREQALAVIKHFNIRITERDIFSRCQVCNNSQYLIIDVSSMRSMLSQYDSSVKSPTNGEWFKLSPSVSYNMNTLTLDNGMPLQLKPVSERVLNNENVDSFFACALCGKVFWTGSHYDRVHQNFENILTLSEDGGLPSTSQ